MNRFKNIQNIYLLLVLQNTFATSLIWGINTIFLLSAGLSNFQAFAANAFFTLGQVLSEIPTGIVADTYGRRTSYLLGTLSLSVSTILYYFMWQIQGPFWGWAVSSMFLGIGYAFFSGATEAWLVDALTFTKFKGHLESVFAKGQIAGGVAMLIGSIAGGIIAQYMNLGVPYILRGAILIINFFTAFILMRDLGFTPKKPKNPVNEMKSIFNKSVKYGLGNRPVRFLMFSQVFLVGLSFYVFYALQPYLLELYGDDSAYAIAGLVAALVAVSNIIGGITASRLPRLFSLRTSILILGTLFSGIVLIAVSFVTSFWVALILILLWGLMFSALMPVRQTYINGLIPSEQRATVLSFDSLMGSSGGIVIQPALGKVADIYNYSTSYMVGSLLQFAALPFIYLSRKENAKSDIIEKQTAPKD